MNKVKTVDAILYSRVSTDEQVESGLGLEDQRKRLDGMATAKGWESTLSLSDEGVSAKSLEGQDSARRSTCSQLARLALSW